MNALETCRRHVPTLWCLRYGVYVMVLLNLLNCVRMAHIIIYYKKKQVPFVGEPALWGYVCGLRLIWWRVCSRRLR